MDEPTSALSPAECARLFRIVAAARRARASAIVYISHRIDEVMALADRVTVLRDGRHVLTAPIGELSRDAADRGDGRARDARRAAGGRARAGAASVLSVRGLTLDVPARHGWRRVLDGVDFDLHAGEVLGIGGLLGSGRTEILETLFGASAGPARRRDRARRRAGRGSARRAQARRLGLALVTEDRKAKGLHLGASIRDNVALPSLGRHRALRRALGRRRGARWREDAVRAARRALHRHRAGRGDALGRQPAEGGDRQVAGDRAARAAARRADARHRRRRQAGDLRRWSAALAAEGLAILHGQLGAARAAAARRPHPGDVRGAADRRCSTRAEASEEAIMHLAAPAPAARAAS